MRKEPLEVYYDGDCDLCSAAAKTWRRTDQHARLEFRPLQGDLPAGAPGRARLEQAIHVHGPEGWQSGAKALLAIYRRLPGGRLPATILSLGIALGIADPLYRLVARHRAHLPAWLARRPEGP